MRSPIGLYRMGLGGVLGRRFLLLEHVGRRSGVVRRTVLEVVEIQEGGLPVVVSGFGVGSDWYRNVTAQPDVTFTIGRRRVGAVAERIGQTDAIAVFDRYRTTHPRAARMIGNKIGVSLVADLEGSASKLPLFRLIPCA